MSEKTTKINYDVPSCQKVEVNGELKGFAVFCPVSPVTGSHKLQKTWPISKSTGKTRIGGSTKGRQTMMLQPLEGDTRMANFTASVWIQSTNEEIQEGLDAGIVNLPK